MQKKSFFGSTFSHLFHEFQLFKKVKWTNILKLFSEDHFLEKKVDHLGDYFHIGPLPSCIHRKKQYLVDLNRIKKDRGPFYFHEKRTVTVSEKTVDRCWKRVYSTKRSESEQIKREGGNKYVQVGFEFLCSRSKQ